MIVFLVEILRNVLHATGGEVEDSCTLVTATYTLNLSFLCQGLYAKKNESKCETHQGNAKHHASNTPDETSFASHLSNLYGSHGLGHHSLPLSAGDSGHKCLWWHHPATLYEYTCEHIYIVHEQDKKGQYPFDTNNEANKHLAGTRELRTSQPLSINEIQPITRPIRSIVNGERIHPIHQPRRLIQQPSCHPHSRFITHTRSLSQHSRYKIVPIGTNHPAAHHRGRG